MVIALKIAGSGDEAMAATKGLIDAAEVTRNPHVLSFALLAYGTLSATPIPTVRGRPCFGAGRPCGTCGGRRHSDARSE